MIHDPLQVLHDAFADLDDPRVDRTKEHLLLDSVTIAICAVICGADSWGAVAEFGKTKQRWLQSFLALPNGIPSHDIFGRVFAALDAEQFQQGCTQRVPGWVRAAWPTATHEVIAVDGKPLRRSHDHSNGKDAIHQVRGRGTRGSCLPNAR
jgi:hypothetical protein